MPEELKNYIEEHACRLTVLRQWRMVTGTINAPAYADPDNPTADETSAIGVFEVRKVSAYFLPCSRLRQIRSRTHKGPQDRLGSLEKHFGVKLEGR